MALTNEQLTELKKQYPHDTRIYLQNHSGEPDMPEGLRGSVDTVSDDGQLYVHWDNGRVTTLISGEDEFRKLTFEEAELEWLTIKLYSPLKAQYYEVYDSEYLSDQRISGARELTDSIRYRDDINAAIHQSLRDYSDQEELFISGVGAFNLGSDIPTIRITAEEHENELWGVMELKLTKPLSPAHTELLKGYVEDEYKDGWGKYFGFDKIPAKDDGHYRLNIHFWQDSADYRIMTESEFISRNELTAESVSEEETPEEAKEPSLRIDIIKNGYHQIELPMTEYDIIRVLYDAGCDLSDAEYMLELQYWDEYDNLDLTGVKLQEMNHFAKLISEFDEMEKESLYAYMKTQETVSIKQLINAAHNINDIILYPFGDDEELGEFALDNEMIEEYESLPDSVYEALDKEKAGAKFREIDGGTFVYGGYLKINDFDEVYDGITLPNSKPLAMFQAELCYDDTGNSMVVEFPTTGTAVIATREKFKVDNIRDLYMSDFNSTIPYLSSKCEVSMDCYDELNRLAVAVHDMDQVELHKFKAVLEVEQPFFIKDVLDLTAELNKYRFASSLTHPEDYARHEIGNKFDISYEDSIMKHINLREFGKELMSKDGLIPTQYGAVYATPTAEETQSAEVAKQDEADEDESEEQEFEGMQMT